MSPRRSSMPTFSPYSSRRHSNVAEPGSFLGAGMGSLHNRRLSSIRGQGGILTKLGSIPRFLKFDKKYLLISIFMIMAHKDK